MAIDTLYARGGFAGFGLNGTATFESLPYVLTPSIQQLAQGTRFADPPFNETLDWRDGTALVYDLNPVQVGARGDFILGENGVATILDTPQATFDDFAVFERAVSYLTVDPVDGYVIANNDVTSGGAQQPWARYSKVFMPPRKARFLVPAIYWQTMPAQESQYLDSIQIEEAEAATTFKPAREVQVSVRPTRLNYSTSPDAIVTTTGASAYNEVINSLIVGKTYIYSVTVVGGNINFTLTGATLHSQGDEGTRQWVTFTATATSVTVHRNAPASGIVLSDPLCEVGTVLRSFFDGGSGPDYLWEQGGTPGSARSYYYEDRGERHYILVRSLQENVPLGTPVADPQYAAGPPTS